ncbi:unnamed protein product, partial [Vitis vinifera]|uniref:Uncharacterized protein n=1 Tax=Vitis vinifera TaxID=29760 RepID=D7T0P2_VITVI
MKAFFYFPASMFELHLEFEKFCYWKLITTKKSFYISKLSNFLNIFFLSFYLSLLKNLEVFFIRNSYYKKFL